MTTPDIEDADDPGTADADLSAYSVDDLSDPSECGGWK